MVSEEIRKKYADGTRGVNPEVAAARDVIAAVKQQKLEQSRQEEAALRQAMVDTSKQWNRQRQAALRGQQATPAAPEKTAAQKLEEAQAVYDAYVQSDEYKQNQVANMKAQTDEWMNATIIGNEVYTPTPRQDQKEQELKALVDHYTEQVQKEEDQATLGAALQELETWDEADRKALEAYWVQDTWERQHPMADPITGGSRQVSGEIAEPLFAKYGEAKVRRLAEALEWQQSAELAEQATTVGQGQAGESFFDNVGADLASIGAKGAGNLTGPMGYITELGRRTGQFSTLNPNNIGQIPNVYGDALQGQKAENLAADGGNLDAYLYKGGMSAADSGLRMLMGGGAAGGAALAASGSFARELSEASAQGAAPAEAALMAAATAGIEYATEKVPLDKLMDAAKAGGHGLKDILKNALIQGGIEAGEEELSLIGTTLAEAAILREKSGYQQQIQELVASGMDLKIAQNAAFEGLLQEAKETAIVSFLSGGLSEAGASAVGNLTHRGSNPARVAPEMQQNPENAANNAATDQEQAPAQTPEEVAEQMGREAPKAAPKPKSEQELTLERAMDETFGREGNEAGSAAGDLERLQAQEESLRAAADAYASAGDNRAAAEVEADRQKYGDQVRAAQAQEEARTGSLTDKDAPAQQEAPYPSARNQDSDPLRARSWAEAGDRRTKAYMAENPEVKPFIQQEAQAMAEELANTTKGERGYNEDVHYESGGEKGWWGVSRHTSEDIAELRDSGMSYEQIGKGLNDIIEDHGKENSAAAKRVEMQLNDRLRSGHKDFMTGKWVQPNQAYIEAVNETEANRESREGFDALMEDADTYAPPAQDAEGGAQQADTGKVSSRGEQPGMKGTGAAQNGGFEAMGAADQNFSNKPAYNATLSEDNAQPDRRDDVRPMELPARDINGGDVSEVTANVYGSKITPDALASLMEERVAKGDFSYAKITNDQATERAMETIRQSGTWENAYREWSNQVAQGAAGAEMSARGALLLNRAAQQGNKGEWLSILGDLQKMGTNTAQGLQALRIIRKLNPADKAEFIQTEIRAMVRDMKLDSSIQADEKLLEKYVHAKGDTERDAILDEIQQNVADQIPSTFLDKFTALRYMNMLGNIKTNARNVGGNLTMKGVYKLKDTVAAGVEEVLHRASGGKFEKSKSLTVSKELRKACKADFAQYAGIVSDGGKFGDRQSGSNDFAQGVMDKRRIFKGDVSTKNEKFNAVANKVIDTTLTPMEWYRKGTNWAMNNKYFGDEAFGRGAYARAMAGYLKAHGVKGGDLSNVNEALLDRARAYAIQEAQEATFHDNTALARIVQKGQKAFGIVGEGIMPFTKTPANILVRAEEFSPLGFINSTVKSLQSAAGDTKLTEKNGRLGQWAKAGREITGADIVNSWAKTLTGTAIFALGAVLRDQGWLTASGDDDEDEAAFDKLNGEQEYALMLPDGSNYTLDFLGPAVMPLFMGAELSKAIEEAGGFDELTWADWENILTSVSDPMLQMSMLSGINDSLSNIKYADNSLMQLCINAAVSYLTQGLGNTLLGQMEKSTEEVRTQTYIDKDSQTPAWMQKQLGSLSQKIPLWDYQQTPYIDARGQEQAQPTGFDGWLYNLVSPGYLDKKEVDSVSEELYRLNETGATESNVFLDSPSTTFSYTDKDGIKHEDYNLSVEEAEALKRSVGKTSVDVLQALFETDTYKAMTDQQKTDALKYVDDYAREKGRTEAVEGYEGMSDWMKSIDGNAAEAIINKTVEAAFSDAFSLADRDPAAAAEALDQAYSLLDPNGRLAWAQEAGSKEEAFIMAKARKIDTQTFAGLYQQYKEIGKDKSMDESQKAQEWADVLQKAQEAGDLTKAQKEGLKKDLIFYNQIPASSAKYDTMTNQGMDSDSADYIVGLLDGIEATADKLDKIAGAKLPEEQKDIAMKAWMDDYDPKAKKPDYTEVKYDYIRQELGYSATEYSAAKRLYSSDGTKEAKIDRIEDKLGITDAQARELYGILDGNKNALLKDWAKELYG